MNFNVLNENTGRQNCLDEKPNSYTVLTYTTGPSV
jgi:hypothetical protein